MIVVVVVVVVVGYPNEFKEGRWRSLFVIEDGILGRYVLFIITVLGFFNPPL